MFNLLLVDDETDSREALSSYFPWNDTGFQIIGQASNGKEALDFIENNGSVDIVLTDIKMPVMSGIELAEAVYNRNKKVKIVFLSSYREFEYAQEALKYKVLNYVLKPAKYQVLADVFGKVNAEMQAERNERRVSGNESEPAESSDKGMMIGRIKSYVRENYKNATLDEAARNVHLNANYLSFVFKQKTNQTFSDYLIQVKMEAALKLLQDSACYKTYEISEMVGYSSAKNFTRTFKQFYGKTPSEIRNGTNEQ